MKLKLVGRAINSRRTSALIRHNDPVDDLRDDVVGATLPTAARVVGVPVERLRAWSDRGLVVPSYRQQIGRRYRWSYSLDELVQARLVKALEAAGVGVRQIALVVEAAKAVSESPLTRLSWAVSAGEAFVQYPSGEWYGGRRPNQIVLHGVLDLAEIRAETRKALGRPRELAGRVETRRGVHNSRPVFEGTRVPVDTVRGYVDAGFADEHILRSFPSLYTEDVEYARRLAKTG